MSLKLQQIANRNRRLLLEAIWNAKAGHTGGSLSCVDILTVLYNAVLNVSPETADHPERDRYIQSKGHSVEALFAVLASRGFIPEEELATLCQFKSRLIGHPLNEVPGIEQNTGALGHGLPIAAGAAYGGKLDKRAFRVFTLLGDGELAEGSNWEAANFAGHYGLDNLVAIIDYNKLQITGDSRDVMGIEPLADRWKSFGWEVRESDGHDHAGLASILKATPWSPGKPSLLIAHTVKGKGISFMENVGKWHHGVPKADQYARALEEIDQRAATLKQLAS